LGGETNNAVATTEISLNTQREFSPWPAYVCESHEEGALLQDSITSAEHATANLLAPEGNIVTCAGDPFVVVQDLPPTLHTDVLPQLTSTTTPPKGVHFVMAGLKKLAERSLFNSLLASIHSQKIGTSQTF
jgi:hypothetical protein